MRARIIDFSRFEVLSFDCYGTIIDWERGIVDALGPVLSAHNVELPSREALELFAALESRLERGEYMSYRNILQRVLDGFGERYGFEPTSAEREAFARSVGSWPPFPDSAAALRSLKKRFTLAVISNVDDDLFAATAKQLGVDFDWTITAQQVRSYKPSHNNFLRALDRIGCSRERQLHVAQSLYHDIAPANELGLTTVWVDRRGDEPGSGATPAAAAQPDLSVPDLETLAALAAS